jgi:hypothetical protein
MSALKKSPLIWFFVILILIAVMTALGPAEKTLGVNVRVVYLHGAWVWTALATFVCAGVTGLAGLVTRRQSLNLWSRALGRTGLFFWITYLPISLWAMQTNWNGLFLAEPRWRLAVIFAFGGLVLQIGLVLVDKAVWDSALNLVFAVILILALQNTQQVMHPPAPMLNSTAWGIQIYFGALVILTMLGAWQVTGWWRKFDLG